MKRQIFALIISLIAIISPSICRGDVFGDGYADTLQDSLNNRTDMFFAKAQEWIKKYATQVKLRQRTVAFGEGAHYISFSVGANNYEMTLGRAVNGSHYYIATTVEDVPVSRAVATELISQMEIPTNVRVKPVPDKNIQNKFNLEFTCTGDISEDTDHAVFDFRESFDKDLPEMERLTSYVRANGPRQRSGGGGASDVAYPMVTRTAQFPGGMQALNQYIDKNRIYPKEAAKQRLRGTVVVSFIIDESGAVDNLRVVRSVHPILDQEAVRLVKMMPLWEPALNQGEPVRCNLQLPILFKPGR